MNRELLSLLAVCGVQLVSACAGSSGGGGGGTPPATDPKCQLNSKNEQTPGFPYNTAKFTTDVLPYLQKSCGLTGCHASPTGQGGLTIWASAASGNCDFAQTFNSVAAMIDPANPGNSQLTSAVTGGDPVHPIKLMSTDTNLLLLQDYINDAAATLSAAGGGGETANPGASPFDYAVFKSTIEPAIDAAGCAKDGCHGGAGQQGFALKLKPTAEADLTINFTAVTARGELSGDPATGIFYVQAYNKHLGVALADSSKAAVLDWLTKAKTAAGGAGNGANNCPPISGFNPGVFNTEIMPILSGTLDLNVPGGVGHGGGCTKTACHGTDRGAGTLALVPGSDSAKLLQNFACFVNVTSPQQSEILLCPANQSGCRKSPHPGDTFFDGATDLNYQRILSYIYGSKLNISPLDYAFYVRKINSIFVDPNSVQAGAANLTCADAIQCHGINGVGGLPPNGSDFGIIANASSDTELTANFVSATGFANFIQPSESSLFLYPTNEIADVANHPLATGIDHPGGLDFAPDSALAQSILTWVAGLRPDAQGFARNWLVEGDFAVNAVTDATAIDETSVNPRIFDLGGGSANQGQWDGLFSDSAIVNLEQTVGVKDGINRVAYASAYVINSLARTQQVNLIINTNNPLQVYIDGRLSNQNNASGGTQAFMTLPPNKPVHVLIKLQQRENDAQLAFTAQTVDNNNVVLTDKVGGLIYTLAPNGGL